jgi:uncharacterized membrane protein
MAAERARLPTDCEESAQFERIAPFVCGIEAVGTSSVDANGKPSQKGQTMMKVTRVLAAGALAASASVPLMAGVAHAVDECYPHCKAPSVLPLDISRNPGSVAVAPAEAAQASNVAGSGSTLPFTGADVIELSLIGLGAVGIGTVLVRRSRRTA